MRKNRICRKGRGALFAFIVSVIVFVMIGNDSLSVFAWNGDAQVQEGPTETAVPSPAAEIVPELTVTGAVQEGYISLAWTQVTGAISYEVYRAPKGKDSFRKIGETDTNYFQDETVVRGKNYDYYVAVIMEGSSCQSETVSGACPLRRVTNVRLRRYSSSSIQVAWKKNRNAACYRIYAAKGSPVDFKCVGITKKTGYCVKRLKKNHKYFIRVQACAARKLSEGDGAPSKAAAIRMKTFHRMTVFAGDSITTGLNSYRTINRMRINGKRKVVAAIGLNTTTFRTRRCFGGKSGLDRVISYKPYRLYMMLGINEIHYRSSADVAAGYRDLIDTIREKSPDTEIILLAVSPVTKQERLRREGFHQISQLNKRLKKLAKKKHLKYYDYTGFLKDKEGYLSTKYAVGDGVHWNAAGYDHFGKVMSKYDRKLNRF